MTFKHKLSARLARLWLPLPLVALVTVASCGVQARGPNEPVTPPPVDHVLLSPPVVTLATTKTTDFVAVGLSATGDTTVSRVTWAVSGGSLLQTTDVGDSHIGRYQAGAQPGTYRVIVTTSVGTAVKADTADVIVTTIPVASVVVTPAAAALQSGQTAQLTASPQDAGGAALSGRAITWSSGNSSVASISASGLVTAKAAGSATITATSEGQSGSASVSVTQVPVALVQVTPAADSIAVGSKVQLTAVAKDASGAILSGRAMTWSSSNAQIAVVAAGLVTGVAAGNAAIVVSVEGKADTAMITVTVVPVVSVASVRVSPAAVSLPVATAVQLTATPADATGAALSGRVITWSSSNPLAATVSASGLVTTLAEGSAQITATCEGRSGSATITVTAAPPVGTCGASWPAAVYAPMPPSTGQEFYVSPSGSDANPGTIGAPWKTLQKAFDALQPGQIAYLRAGTYGTLCGSSSFTGAGTASAPITVQGYPGERAVLHGQIRLTGSYMRLSYIVMEGPTCGNWGDPGRLGENMIQMDVATSRFIEVSHSEVYHGGWHAGIAAGGDDIYLLDNYIHDNGNFNDPSQLNTSHGIYYHDGSRGVVANNLLEHNFAKGLSARFTANHVLVLNNTVVGNGRSGMDIAEGTNNWVFANNVVLNNGNVNGGVGINTGGSSGGTTNVLINNVLWNNGSSGSSNFDSNPTLINNLEADPLLGNPTSSVPGPNHAAYANDYQLRAGSPAINFGSPAYAPPADIRGLCRPQAGGFDAGAYESGP